MTDPADPMAFHIHLLGCIGRVLGLHSARRQGPCVASIKVRRANEALRHHVLGLITPFGWRWRAKRIDPALHAT